MFFQNAIPGRPLLCHGFGDAARRRERSKLKRWHFVLHVFFFRTAVPFFHLCSCLEDHALPLIDWAAPAKDPAPAQFLKAIRQV